MKVKHYATIKTDLGSDKLDKEAWERLRMDTSESAYCIEDSVDLYEQNCKKYSIYCNSAKTICKILKQNNCRHIITVGTGKGILEWYIKKYMPDLYVECTDYAEETIDKLKKVFADCDDLHAFDMLEGDYGSFNKEAFVIFFRVSTELNYKQWRQCFKKMHDAGIRNIIFVPDEIASVSVAKREITTHMKNRLKKKKDTFCGWIYSADEYRKLFQKSGYQAVKKVKSDILHLFVLKKV